MTSDNRLHAQDGQRGVADIERWHLFRLADSRYADRISLIHSDILERAPLLAVNEVVGGRHIEFGNVDARGLMPHANQFLGVRIGERLQQDALKNAEYDGVGAHSGRQRDQSDHREHRRPLKSSYHLPQLVFERTHWPGLPVHEMATETGTLKMELMFRRRTISNNAMVGLAVTRNLEVRAKWAPVTPHARAPEREHCKSRVKNGRIPDTLGPLL